MSAPSLERAAAWVRLLTDDPPSHPADWQERIPGLRFDDIAALIRDQRGLEETPALHLLEEVRRLRGVQVEQAEKLNRHINDLQALRADIKQMQLVEAWRSGGEW